MPYDDSLNQIYHLLRNDLDLLEQLTNRSLQRFIVHVARLKRDIWLTQGRGTPRTKRPDSLPRSMLAFLAHVMHTTDVVVDRCWTLLGDMAWDDECAEDLQSGVDDDIRRYGLAIGIGALSLYPPNKTCTNPECGNTSPLTQERQQTAVIFTLARGTLPGHMVRLKCPDYHHDYSVHERTRTYYKNDPTSRYIQVGGHQFMERSLIDMFLHLMQHAWVSAGNAAKFYNETIGVGAYEALDTQLADEWQFSFNMQGSQIWDGIITQCLLEDHEEQQTRLQVPHNGKQSERFKRAMMARNERIQRHGLPSVGHACDRCARIWRDPGDGKKYSVSAVVIDGITIGHPCCGVHNCQTPLRKQNDHFCEDHDHLNQVCRVVGCDRPTSGDSRVCDDEKHKDLEKLWKYKREALFQPLDAAARARLASANDSGVPDIAEAIELPGQKVRGKFKQAHTHNEQLIIAPCGMIIARVTFYGAEAVSSVVQFIKRVYHSLPPTSHIFFDNNCNMKRHIETQQDHFFANMGLPVDVFHFKCKHKETDEYCRRFCDPDSFPELRGPDGGWFFNSSVCEQTNVWLAGYHAMTREMTQEKFNFFLDELIMRRNRATELRLKRGGAQPFNWRDAIAEHRSS